ncbi:MAG TPA: T9SS type A sorting domain-containing protein [Cyclobacteriaceae bacterium]|nr:T9SS type A sorting domain-containing protein [Cyclobacteriaceae bacterium]
MRIFSVFTVFIWLAFFSSKVHAQLASQCQTCFTSEFIKAEKNGTHCTNYQLKVSYNVKCDHALSHVTVAVPSCASVSHVSADQSCSTSIGFDPTTGLNGFKIEGISNFGQSSLTSFVVSFTICASDTSCHALSCWSPTVAYKASNCFDLDTLRGLCPKLSAHLLQKNVTCQGSANGELTVVVDEGSAPFQYAWSTSATTASLQNLTAGSYSVYVTDATGAKVSLSTVITQPAFISINPIVTNASCNGQANGAIQTNVSGGSGTKYTYQWNTGAASASLDSLKAGTYTVKVTDSLGCATQASFQVRNEKQITLSFAPQFPSCNQPNGSLWVTAIGGVEPYHYLWSTGDTIASISNAVAGNYSVTVADASGCSAAANFSLHENNTLKINYTVTPTSCVDDSSGGINVTITGGTPPYSYLWSNGATSEDLEGLPADAYTLTVTDSVGCQRTARISVFRKTFQVTSQVTQPKCFGDSTGSISLAPLGAPPYQFVWSTGATADSVGNLTKGTYTVTVTDSTGCSKVLSYTIASPAPLAVTDTVTNVSCNSYSINISSKGGTAPYQYIWSTGAQTQNLTNVSSGVYGVKIIDVNGCSLTKEIKIDSAATLTCLIKPLNQPPTCNTNGNIIFTDVTNATFQWGLTSSDGSWHIQSGASNDTLIYSAGVANSTATVSLTVSRNGCSQTCSYPISACTGSSTGGNNNENCNDCFKSSISLIADEQDCITYTVNISTDGNCRYDLSHFVIAVPCGQISNYSDSKGWPLVEGRDPTTRLTGLKVDNANNFGKTVDSFTLRFSVCGGNDCIDKLKKWNPVVAYKAGQCVAYDTLSFSSSVSNCLSIYPNPVRDSFSIEMTTDEDDEAVIDLFNQYGQKVGESIKTRVIADQKNTIKVDASSLPTNIYLYQVKTSKSRYHGRILKSN